MSRQRILSASGAILTVAFEISIAKGWFDFLPDGVVVLLWFLPVVLWIYWLYTHESRKGFVSSRPMLSLASFILIGGVLGAAAGALGWWSIHRQPMPARPPINVADGSPGLSLENHIRINNLAGKRRKYLFDLGRVGGPRLSVYISPDNVFTESFTDPNGEVYSVQVPIGAGGIPIGEFIYLSCEISVSAQTSILRVLVDGKPIVMRGVDVGVLELPFRVDIVALDVPNGTMGADLDGANGAAIDLLELVAVSVIPKDKQIEKLKKYFDSRPRTRFVQFNGNQWMRIKNASGSGGHDAEQEDKAHQPVYRDTSH